MTDGADNLGVKNVDEMPICHPIPSLFCLLSWTSCSFSKLHLLPLYGWGISSFRAHIEIICRECQSPHHCAIFIHVNASFLLESHICFAKLWSVPLLHSAHGIKSSSFKKMMLILDFQIAQSPAKISVVLFQCSCLVWLLTWTSIPGEHLLHTLIARG